MSNELKNIKVELVSLVGKAANQRTVIFKSASCENESFDNPLATITIKKIDDEERMVYGIVYAVDSVDSQGDFAKDKEVSKAMIGFMKSLDSTAKMDTQHNLVVAPGVFIVENWKVRKNDELFPEPENLKAWAMGAYVENDEIWKAIKDGEYTGFSMYGTAERVPDVEVEKGLVNKVISEVKKYFNMESKEIKLVKDFNQLANSQEIQDYVWALSDSIRQAINDETVTDKTAAILTNIDQFKAKIESITLAKGIVKEFTESTADGIVMKAGKTLSADNLTKLQAAIDNMNAILAVATKVETQTKSHNTMDEKIQKQIDDAVKVAVEKAVKDTKAELETAHTAKITELQTTIDTQKAEIDTLKSKSPGSGQGIPETQVEKSEKGIDWL